MSNIYCLIAHYNYGYFKINITLPLPSWATLAEASLNDPKQFYFRVQQKAALELQNA